MNYKKLIASTSYRIYNVNIAKALSPTSSIILGYFCDLATYYEDREEMTIFDGKEYFFCTRERIEDATGFSVDAQRTACNILVKEGILEIIRKGQPARNYYRIDSAELGKFLERIDTTSRSGESPHQEVGKVHDILLTEELITERLVKEDTSSISNISEIPLGINKCSNSHLNERFSPNGKGNGKRSFESTHELGELTDDMEISSVMQYYDAVYTNSIGRSHPRIKAEQLEQLNKKLGELMGELILEVDEVNTMIDYFFEHPPKNCDMNINVFLTNGVFVRVGYSAKVISGYTDEINY